MQTRRDSEHKQCFYCAVASASRAVTCRGLGGPDCVTEEIYATLSIKVQLRWTRAVWRRCESVCFMLWWYEAAHSHAAWPSFSQSCCRGSFMQEVSFVGFTLSHGVVRWICRSQLITYLRICPFTKCNHLLTSSCTSLEGASKKDWKMN